MADILYHEAKEKFSKINGLSINDFLEFGWMLEITDECGVEKLYELANFDGINGWRTLSNSLIHNTFSFHQYSYTGKERMIIEATYIIIALLDAYICSYHRFTGFDFIINNVSYRKAFISLMEEFIDYRKNLYF